MNFSEKDIFYEDKDIMVIKKMAGIPVQHARTGQMDLEHLLLNYLAAKEDSNARRIPYLGVIHRLDQPVEGILVFAKNQKSARILNDQMQKGQMKKEYLAIVQHQPEISNGILVDYLLENSRSNISRVVKKDDPGSKRAELEYRVLEKDELYGTALVQIILKTGRRHQIRVQMSHAGMPLCGDRKYNMSYNEKESLALCAYRLTFRHPTSGHTLMYESTPENPLFYRFHIQD
ncbi:RluA family pseudouridine synthase [Novisyntrophococcus fermenticellae]|uniref:RluA family pseudouridine synthase n=1 Tax=Novisyntrophococcus fermenticellae TaxID=2068655 RepID=UPI001E5B3C31|nr:RNA pseudouridine synthase [Novisyntrophococcus fermenticellae]